LTGLNGDVSARTFGCFVNDEAPSWATTIMAGYTRERKSDRRIIAENVNEWIDAEKRLGDVLYVQPAVFPLKSTNDDPYIGWTRDEATIKRIR